MTPIEDPLFVEAEIPIRAAVIRRFKVESVTGESFEVRHGMRGRDGWKSHLLLSDGSGKRKREEKYSRDGSMIYEWIYDAKGMPLREVAYEESGKVNYRIELIYNQGDAWREKRVYLSGNNLHYRIVGNRDAAERLVEGVYYDASDHRIRTDSYIYDDRERLVKVNMEHMGDWIFEYSEDDNLKTKTGHLPGASALGETFEFQYDGRGLLMQRDHLHYSTTVFEYGFLVPPGL